MQTGKPEIRFEILDSIRGIASLYVVIAHCRGTLWIGGNEYKRMFPIETWSIWDYLMVGSSMLTRLAVEFVIVFFLLSGFSIAHSLAKSKAPLPFYKRRFIRIYPSYIIALIWAGLVFVVTRLLFPSWYDGTIVDFSFMRTIQMNNFFDGEVVLGNLFYLPGEGFVTPFWSLTYEVLFYLLSPFLLRKINCYVGVSIILFLSNIGFPVAISQLNLHPYIYNFLFIYNIYFAAGVLLYKHFDSVLGWFGTMSRQIHLFVMIFVLAVMYAINFYLQAESAASFVASAFLSFFMIVYFLKYRIKIAWLMTVGKYSYTLYITHFASIYLYLGVYWLVFRPDKPYILNYLVWIPAVLFCLGIAYLQYLAVESRTKEILNKLRGRISSKSK